MQATFCPYCLKLVTTDTCPYCGSDVHYKGNPMHMPVGSTLNGRHPYVLGACRGQGGFGVTYIALDAVTQERVAIKEYFPTYCSGRTSATSIESYYGQEEAFEKGKEHFLEEARMLQSLADLSGVVNVLDFFEANNTAYLVMEFLDGCSLKDYVQRNGKLPAKSFFEQLRPLMEDMEAMHQRGVIHRDIAPDNIILQPDGTLKLIDFGAARSYISGKSMSVVVKKGFAPVEQYLRTGLNASTDVYAIAASIYFCITGIIPPDSAERQYGNISLKSPIVLGADITDAQEKALERALEIQPSMRTQSVSELIHDLFAAPEVVKPKKPKAPEIIFYQEDTYINAGSCVEVYFLKLEMNYEHDVMYASAGFRNLSDKPIDRIRIALRLTDKEGNLSEEELLLDVPGENACYNAGFGHNLQIALPTTDVKEFRVSIRQIVFADGSVSECVDDWDVIEDRGSIEEYFNNDPELIKQFRLETYEKATRRPHLAEHYHICCCGAHNIPDADKCLSCGTDFGEQIFCMDTNLLRKRADERIQEERRLAEEEAERLRQEKLRKEEERRQKIAQFKKKAKKVGIAAAIVAVIGTAIYVTPIIINSSKYDAAQKLLKEGKYLEAHEAFDRLGIYEDSSYMAKVALYAHGEALLDTKDYDGAYDTFASLGKYSDSEDRAKEAMHFKGRSLMDAQDYAGAMACFEIAGDYNKSHQLAATCRNYLTYNEAMELFNNGNYEEAAQKFTALGDFEDSVECANSSRYHHADQLLGSGEFIKAAEIFENLGYYSDSSDRAKDCRYQYAESLVAQQKHAEAASAFKMLGNYSDSKDRASELYYDIAAKHFDEGKYLEAYDVFATLGNYKDSQNRANEACYTYAGQLVEKGKLHNAYTYYKKIWNYSDSSTLGSDAEYNHGLQQMESGNYDEGGAAFRNILSYKDSATKANECDYQYALGLENAGKWQDASEAYENLKYRDSANRYLKCRYEYGKSLIASEKYEKAIEVLEEVKNYSDSKNQINEAKYKYLVKYKDTLENNRFSLTLYGLNEKKAFEFGKELKKLNYKDSVKIYKNLFGWKVTLTSFNSKKDDYTTILSSVSRYVDYLHFEFDLEGGGPGETVTLGQRLIWPNGATRVMDWYWEDMKAGDNVGAEWGNGPYTDPDSGSVGNLTIQVFIKGTNEVIGEATIRINKN